MGIAALPDPSDAQLFEMAAALLAAVPGPMLGSTPALSTVLSWSCSTFYDDAACQARAGRLARALAEYLQTWHVLRGDQATPAGLDAWAATARVAFLRTALAACARHHAAGGA
jgi:hypothetical protein